MCLFLSARYRLAAEEKTGGFRSVLCVRRIHAVKEKEIARDFHTSAYFLCILSDGIAGFQLYKLQ
jgi:hypothetical protein